MNLKFSNTIFRFTIYGVVFGLCFPVFSCITFCSFSEGEFSFSKAFELHKTNILQQVIDLAPFVLGLMGYLIGVKQKSIEDAKQRLQELYEVTEKFYPVKFLQFLKKDTHFIQLGDNLELQATVLFTDIRDFTKLSEKLSPKEVMDFINEYLAVCIPVIEKYGGIIDKFIGDAIMVVYPTEPKMALESVIEMYKALENYNQKRLLMGQTMVRTGFGLHYGKISLGTIGTKQRMQTTVFGDTVNLASRMESLTKEFKAWVLMSGDFAIKVAHANQFHLREIDIAKIRGREESVPIYECYDVDDAGIIALKDSYKFDLLRALNSFREGEFTEAEAALREISSLNPADPVPLVYLNRCIEKRYEEKDLFTDRKTRVIVIDDNELIFHIIELYLRPYNCEIQVYNNGILGLANIENFLPQLVFLDYNLPDMNGIDIATIMKEKISSLNLNTKLILMTATEKELFTEYLEKKIIDEFIPKPFEKKDVIQIVEKYLKA